MTSEYAKELYEKYPKAFGEFVKGKHIESYNLRDLYDYFDKLNIKGGIDGIWSWWVMVERPVDHPDSYEHYEGKADTRTEAEQEMFTCCFEIREQQLKS